MHLIHNEIWVPKISQQKKWNNVSSFKVWPFPKGFGQTVWNPLRRVLLSSIPGTRVTWIKVVWATHEYSTLPGVKDSLIDLILNLKELVVSKSESWIEWLKLTKNTAWVVTAWDIQVPSGVEIVNKDMYITEIDKDGLGIEMDIRIEKSIGYVSIQELKKREDDSNVILIDNNFSPVLNVKYEIEGARYGDMTNLDSLDIEITTSGVISPEDALKFSWDMLKSYFSIFNENSLQVEWSFISNVKDLIEREKEEIKEEMQKETHSPIEIMWLSPRTLNALVNGNITTIEQLTKCTETKLSSIKWFGKKAMTEIRSSLWERGLKLLWDD